MMNDFVVYRYEPSTSICNICLNKKTGLTLRDRSWTCPHCGSVHDRDINAAKVIYKKGRTLSLERDNVSPELAFASSGDYR